eukprot:873064-Rhodomonas_salina.3
MERSSSRSTRVDAVESSGSGCAAASALCDGTRSKERGSLGVSLHSSASKSSLRSSCAPHHALRHPSCSPALTARLSPE